MCRVAAECMQGYRVLLIKIKPENILLRKKNILCEILLKTKIVWKIDNFEDSIEAL